MRACIRSGRWAGVAGVVMASAALAAHTPTDATRQERPATAITVHGYWTLDVRNADGSLASHTEFENDLTLSGGAALGKMIGGRAAVRHVMVALDGSAPPCAGSKPCVITPNGSEAATLGAVYLGAPISGFGSVPNDPAVSTTLTVTQQAGGSPRLILSGLATTITGKIEKVRTVVLLQCPTTASVCDPAIEAAWTPGLPNFVATAFPTLTEFTLPAPGIDVAQGQVVTVSVTLTFTS